MKSTLTVFFLFVAASYNLFAQNLIAVQSGDTPEFYTSLDSAITKAQKGDTIYIPGGAFSYANNSIIIDKELHIVGVGHYPDSSSVTQITQLNASITLITGANYSSFEGFYLNGNFMSGKTVNDEDVDHITINRCHCTSIYLSRLSTSWSFIENIVHTIRGNYLSSSTVAKQNYFSNNIIEGNITNFGYDNVFVNNICLFSHYNYIYSYYSSAFDGVEGCLFENNVFLMRGNRTNYGVRSCLFNNNIFIYDFTIPDGSLGRKNITSQTQSSLFIDQTGYLFDYAHNYHLQVSCPGKNAGTDGTDIGIYGGAFPWKEGSIPFNPHFQTFQVSPKTDAKGNLNVNIKVKAQDH